jgi:hypothetical protein
MVIIKNKRDYSGNFQYSNTETDTPFLNTSDDIGKTIVGSFPSNGYEIGDTIIGVSLNPFIPTSLLYFEVVDVNDNKVYFTYNDYENISPGVFVTSYALDVFKVIVDNTIEVSSRYFDSSKGMYISVLDENRNVFKYKDYYLDAGSVSYVDGSTIFDYPFTSKEGDYFYTILNDAETEEVIINNEIQFDGPLAWKINVGSPVDFVFINDGSIQTGDIVKIDLSPIGNPDFWFKANINSIIDMGGGLIFCSGFCLENSPDLDVFPVGIIVFNASDMKATYVRTSSTNRVGSVELCKFKVYSTDKDINNFKISPDYNTIDFNDNDYNSLDEDYYN